MQGPKQRRTALHLSNVQFLATEERQIVDWDLDSQEIEHLIGQGHLRDERLQVRSGQRFTRTLRTSGKAKLSWHDSDDDHCHDRQLDSGSR